MKLNGEQVKGLELAQGKRSRTSEVGTWTGPLTHFECFRGENCSEGGLGEGGLVLKAMV